MKFSVLVALLIFTLSLSACNKFTREVVDVEEPADAPQYTVEFDPNDPPA